MSPSVLDSIIDTSLNVAPTLVFAFNHNIIADSASKIRITCGIGNNAHLQHVLTLLSNMKYHWLMLSC